MSYHEDIFQNLISSAEIAALTSGRVFADVADGTTTTPYLVYQTIAVGGETSHDGEREVMFPLVQFSAWANTKEEALALAAAVALAFDGKTLAGQSRLSFVWSDQHGTRDQATNLYGEILELRGSCNRN